MKGKILKIVRSFPQETRLVPEQYLAHIDSMSKVGIIIPTWKELSDMFTNKSELLLVQTMGKITIVYEDETIVCKFFPGFIYDNASTPWWSRSATDNDSLPMKSAALPHDGMYGTHYDDFPKEVADSIFVDIIEYYNDRDEDDSIFSDVVETVEEKILAVAFDTDEALEHWVDAEKHITYNRMRFFAHKFQTQQ